MLKFGESCVSHLCRISRGMSAGLMLRSRDFPELKKKVFTVSSALQSLLKVFFIISFSGETLLESGYSY